MCACAEVIGKQQDGKSWETRSAKEGQRPTPPGLQLSRYEVFVAKAVFAVLGMQTSSY